MFHPLPVMRMTKILGILTTLVLIMIAPMKHAGILKHPLFLFPFVICLFELLAYKVLNLKDSAFVSAKKLRRIYKTSKDQLDTYVRICTNTKSVFMGLTVVLSLTFQTAAFIVLSAIAYACVMIMYVKISKINTPYGNWTVVSGSPHRDYTYTRTKSYNHYLSQRLGGVFRS
jgi:hypothetical protein